MKLRLEEKITNKGSYRENMYSVFLGDKYLYSAPESELSIIDDDVAYKDEEISISLYDTYSLITGKGCPKNSDSRGGRYITLPYTINKLDGSK